MASNDHPVRSSTDLRNNRLAYSAGFILLASLIYLPGLSGGFLFDDYWNIVENPHLQIASFEPSVILDVVLSGGAGPGGRPLSMLSFATNYYLCGFSPACFKAVNLAIHCFNAWLVFLIGRLLFRRIYLASSNHTGDTPGNQLPLLFALIWLVAPINLTSVLYIVQRMNSLAGLFTLLGVLAYLLSRENLMQSRRGLYYGPPAVLCCALLAVLAKENGVLLLGFIFIIEICFYRFVAVDVFSARCLKLLFIIGLLLPLMAIGVFLMVNPDWLSSAYSIREFTLLERLLSEARVFWFYLRLIFLPSNSVLGIYHDDFVPSVGLLSPITTGLSIVGLLLLLPVAISRLRKSPVFSFAVLWFVTGHLMESTILPLELIHEHRNYIPALGPLFAFVYYLQSPALSPELRVLLFRLLCGVVLIFALITGLRSLEWGNKFSHVLAEVQHHPASSRTQYELGRLYLENYLASARPELLTLSEKHLTLSADADEMNLAPLFGLVHLAFIGQRQPDEALLARLRRVLEESPINLSDTNKLKHLVTCHQNQRCHLPADKMLALFGSLLQNPGLSQQNRHNVLVHLSSYYLGVMKDVEAAHKVMMDVVSESPDVVPYQLGLIHVKIEMGRIAEALQMLDSLHKKINSRDWYKDKTQQLKTLNEIQARARQIKQASAVSD